MAKRRPNQSQTQFCQKCRRDTVHSAWQGRKSDYDDKSGIVLVDAPFGEGEIEVYQHVRQCDTCKVGFSTSIEIDAKEYRTLVSELKALRKLKAAITQLVKS